MIDMAHADPHSSGARPGRAGTLFSSYPVRMMLSLAASLLLVALLFNVPIDIPPDPIGVDGGEQPGTRR